MSTFTSRWSLLLFVLYGRIFYAEVIKRLFVLKYIVRLLFQIWFSCLNSLLSAINLCFLKVKPLKFHSVIGMVSLGSFSLWTLNRTTIICLKCLKCLNTIFYLMSTWFTRAFHNLVLIVCSIIFIILFLIFFPVRFTFKLFNYFLVCLIFYPSLEIPNYVLII